MSRSTLKLPAKPGTPNSVDDPRMITRKPVRSGAKAPKESVAQRDNRLAAKEVFLAAEAEKARSAERRPRPTARFDPDAPRARARANEPESPRRTPETSAPREVRAPELPKVYPKRGIARSTGARAFPPTRPRNDDEASRDAPHYLSRDTPRPTPERQETTPRLTPSPRHPDVPPAPTMPQASPKMVRRPQNEPPRLSKRLSEMTGCSRREADEWIENSWVKVDGAVVTTLGTRVHPNARVDISDVAGKHTTESVTILLNKPLDDVSGDPESSGGFALSLIRPENRWTEDDTSFTFKATHLRGLALAGKLDSESTGMLVFTQEGSVARRIIGDDTRLEKEYMVRVEGELSPDDLKRLNIGLVLDDIKLKRAQVSWQNEQQLRFVLHESKKRQIQRMCELVGLRVTSIKRIRIGSVSLGKLPPGQWRYLRENERF